MTPVFRLISANVPRAALALLSAAALLAGCRHESVVPEPVTDYFPVVVGTYRTYAVADSTWASAQVTVSHYQLRERVTEQFTDAAGQPAYRLVRSRRLTSADGWRDDSALVVQVLPRAVVLTRNNLRTLELVYPVQANKSWNRTAFTVNTGSSSYRDSITNLTRAYGPAVGTPYTTPATPGAAAKTYPTTVLTKDILPVGVEDINDRDKRGVRQVYAQGVGLVLRRRFSLQTFTTASNGLETYTKDVQNGVARYEVLIDSGTI
jgi:hypothetical protein